MHVKTPKKIAQNNRTDLDVYFENLEEAYGNLPVPSDDWAGIGEKLTQAGFDFDVEKLEQAILTIQHHYDDVAKVLGKQQKYG